MLGRRGMLGFLAAPAIAGLAAPLMRCTPDLRLGRWVVLAAQPWLTPLPPSLRTDLGEAGHLMYYRAPTAHDIGKPVYGVRPGAFIDMRAGAEHRSCVSVSDIRLPLDCMKALPLDDWTNGGRQWPRWTAAGVPA